MPSLPTFIVVVSLFLCWTNGQTQVTQQEAAQIVSMHNAARSAVSPSASNMMSMSWDAQLAASAQAYANTCPSGHSGTKGVGENLSWGWPSMDVTNAISMWANEKPYYTYASNSSTKVGCGKQTCANLMGHGKGDVWVCQYSPAGNYVGQKPYNAGTPCSQCPTGSSCSHNMCSSSTQTTTAQNSISSPQSSPVNSLQSASVQIPTTASPSAAPVPAQTVPQQVVNQQAPQSLGLC